MISRKVLWSIAGALVVGFIILWKAMDIPARITIINQSGRALYEVTIRAGAQTFDIGEIRSGETRFVSVGSAPEVLITFRGSRPRRWTNPHGGIGPGQSIVLFITPDETIDVRRKIGTFAR